MCYEAFLKWLICEKQLSQRAAKDVISRCKRICKLLNVETIDASAIERLNSNEEFAQKSTFIKSQLRRAVKLWIEFVQ